jgi:hypothetical protein
LSDADLGKVRQRRLFPTRMTQFVQIQTQNLILAPIIQGRTRKVRPPFFLRIVSRIPFLQRRLARLFGLGVRPEHVHIVGDEADPRQGTRTARN